MIEEKGLGTVGSRFGSLPAKGMVESPGEVRERITLPRKTLGSGASDLWYPFGMRWWLFKTEPETYSWDDLVRDGSTCWEGVRNYQARNLLRDEVALGDLVFVYHSVVQPQVIAGIARVVREAHPDHFALDPTSDYFDPKASLEDPRWLMVDIEPVRPLDPPITRDELKAVPALADMMLLRRGSRLSVQPVDDRHAKKILGLRRVSLDWLR